MLSASVDDIKAAATSLKENLSSSVAIVMGPQTLISEIAVTHGAEVTENTIVLPM